MIPAPTFRPSCAPSRRIGLINFGGPAGQIALMHRELVDEKRWVSEEDYLHALNFCHLLPGPEAQQLAAWIGWKLHGWRGGLAAGLLFVIPGRAGYPAALGALCGRRAARLGRGAVPRDQGGGAGDRAPGVAADRRACARQLPSSAGWRSRRFAGLFLLDLPFPLIVLRRRGDRDRGGRAAAGLAQAQPPGEGRRWGLRPWAATAKAVAVWLAVWAAPMVLVFVQLGPDHVLWKIGAFFSQLAVVTFGGAYAVLAYMAQEAVQGFGWLSAGEMADGLGLAETTPGPLIMVTQFVGYLAAYRAPRRSRRSSRACSSRPDDMGDLRAVLPVDLRLRAVDRPAAPRDRAQGRARRRSPRRWWV